jgi:mRNA-degrading endonuclease RelE of RelBE toxin-antitoxin system
MVEIQYTKEFDKSMQKLSKSPLMSKIKSQILKIIADPLIGKPMRYERKGTRELYIKPYRLAYCFDNDVLIFLTIYHKDGQ